MTQPTMPPQIAEEPAAGPSLSAYEAAFAALVLGALTMWLASVATSVLAGFVRWGLAPDPEGVGSRRSAWVASVNSFMPHLIDMARLGWLQANQDLNLRIPFDPGSQLIQEQLARTRNLLVRISDEVYKEIVEALNKAVAAGSGIEDQAQAVRRVLDVTGSENWPARARTIAVTECNRARGFGVVAHGLTVEQTMRIRVMKLWDSKEDTRVRAAHIKADGQLVPVSDPFIVGGEALMAPGDPSGSPHLVINCRCKPRLRRG